MPHNRTRIGTANGVHLGLWIQPHNTIPTSPSRMTAANGSSSYLPAVYHDGVHGNNRSRMIAAVHVGRQLLLSQ